MEKRSPALILVRAYYQSAQRRVEDIMVSIQGGGRQNRAVEARLFRLSRVERRRAFRRILTPPAPRTREGGYRYVARSFGAGMMCGLLEGAAAAVGGPWNVDILLRSMLKTLDMAPEFWCHADTSMEHAAAVLEKWCPPMRRNSVEHHKNCFIEGYRVGLFMVGDALRQPAARKAA